MPAVAVNSKYVDIPGLNHQAFLKTGSKGGFRVESTENVLPISKGSNILFIKPKDKDLVFTNTAFITKVGDIKPAPLSPSGSKTVTAKEEKLKYHHYFNFEVKSELKHNNKLSELEYSMHLVDNYHAPDIHFHSQIRNVPSMDYETIVNGWVYATRTIFGKLVNSLPRQNKLEFMIQAMDHFSTIDFKETSLLEGLHFLYQYIEQRILSRGRLLVATDGIMRGSLKDILPADKVGFIDPENLTVHNISSQAEIFKKLFDMEKQKNLKVMLEESLKNNKTLEERFQKMFTRRTWPVDLER